MEKSQYDLCGSVLRQMDKAGVLDSVVIVGSWCVMFYERYFNTPDYRATIRTRDLDIAIPRPPRFSNKVDLSERLSQLGFVIDFVGSEGYIRFMHPDLIVDFLVPEHGRTTTKPFDVPSLGVNAQPLRFLNLLLHDTITVPFLSVNVRLPHPANFALHKLLISGRRLKEKAERDQEQAMAVIQALIAVGDGGRLQRVFVSLPRGWQTKITRVIRTTGEDAILALLSTAPK